MEAERLPSTQSDGIAMIPRPTHTKQKNYLLLILDILSQRRHPRTSLLAEQLQLRRRQVDLIGKETILQAPDIGSMTFNDSHGTPAF